VIRVKKVVVLKYLEWVPKNAEFYADFESVEKVFKKMHQDKVISKK
jgi:hypothetical protein